MGKTPDEKTDAPGILRGEKGRFLPGTKPGPGRPRGSRNRPRNIPLEALRDLAQPLSRARLRELADQLLTNREWLEQIQAKFPREVAERIEAHLSVADYALAALIQQLADLAPPPTEPPPEDDPLTEEDHLRLTAAELRREDKDLAELERQLDWLEGREHDPIERGERP